MKKKTKRCEICSSKLDKKGECPWSGCPASPKYQSEVKDEAKSKTETPNS
ncbi:hypothetical protein [uncultured Campylobacter sp.]